jgi:hypothetical protein
MVLETYVTILSIGKARDVSAVSFRYPFGVLHTCTANLFNATDNIEGRVISSRLLNGLKSSEVFLEVGSIRYSIILR